MNNNMNKKQSKIFLLSFFYSNNNKRVCLETCLNYNKVVNNNINQSMQIRIISNNI